MVKNLEKHIEDWTKENTPVGKLLGYPNCCINEFCQQPPILLRNSTPSKIDLLRYRAGCINGIYTGFIPCKKHAILILQKKITLESLIKNRSTEFPKFPLW